MKNLFWVGLLISSLMSVSAIAQTDFAGTWRIDLDKSAFSSNQEILLLQNGMYQCKTCNPAISVKADGEDHNVVGSPYYGAIGVKIVGERRSSEAKE